MVRPIGDLVSEVFYGGGTGLAPGGPLLEGVDHALPRPVTWFDTSKLADRRERRAGVAHTSFINPLEARKVVWFLQDARVRAQGSAPAGEGDPLDARAQPLLATGGPAPGRRGGERRQPRRAVGRGPNGRRRPGARGRRRRPLADPQQRAGQPRVPRRRAHQRRPIQGQFGLAIVGDASCFRPYDGLRRIIASSRPTRTTARSSRSTMTRAFEDAAGTPTSGPPRARRLRAGRDPHHRRDPRRDLQRKKPIPPIDEFALRAVARSRHARDSPGFLGLESVHGGGRPHQRQDGNVQSQPDQRGCPAPGPWQPGRGRAALDELSGSTCPSGPR